MKARLRIVIAAASLLAIPAAPAVAAEAGPAVVPQAWSFSGPFGQYDPAQLRRGLQVYREVCATCHGLGQVAFRTLSQPGGPVLSPDDMRALAAEFEVPGGVNADGDPLRRPGRPADVFPSPFPTPEAAAAANNGIAPPDLSLMAKARAVPRGLPFLFTDIVTQYQEGGPDYIYGYLTGYADPPAGVQPPPGTFYNPHFMSGPFTAMPPALFDDMVDYAGSAPQTTDQYARDVSAFLMWAAEPTLDARKQLGFRVMVFLAVLAALLYGVKRVLWKRIGG